MVIGQGTSIDFFAGELLKEFFAYHHALPLMGLHTTFELYATPSSYSGRVPGTRDPTQHVRRSQSLECPLHRATLHLSLFIAPALCWKHPTKATATCEAYSNISGGSWTVTKADWQALKSLLHGSPVDFCDGPDVP